MKLVFISNFLNHHQEAFCEELVRILGADNFRFIATVSQAEEQKKLGYLDKNHSEYCIRFYEVPDGKNKAEEWINAADIILIGGVSYRYTYKQWLKGKIVIKYGERINKIGTEGHTLKSRLNMFLFHQLSIRKTDYFLAASAYAAGDYMAHGAYRNKVLKWGYFPPCQYYNITELFAKKNKQEILWCGRLIDWKHPEIIPEIARKLQRDGISYYFTVVGDGPLYESLQKIAIKEQLHIRMLGSVPSNQVRGYMEQAGIMLATSDYNEGWGAVINEGMNSACAVVATVSMGAVPFLIKDRKNGRIFDYHNVNQCYCLVKELLQNPKQQEKLGEDAYRTITETWNAKTATENFVNFLEGLKQGEERIPAYGPCSKAEIIMNPTER